jgi:hypothetical protein
MQLSPLKIKVTKERALSLIKEYKDAPYKEPTDAVIISILEHQLKKTKPIINVADAMLRSGLNDNDAPNIALAPLTATEIYCAGYTKDSFILYDQIQEEEDEEGNRWNIMDPDGWKFEVGNVDISDAFDSSRALLPAIPPRIRPKSPKKHFVLWEAELELIPQIGDPALLKQIYGPFFQVVDVWDLTKMEEKVLRGLVVEDED